MKKLIMFIDGSNQPSEPMDCALGLPSADGSIVGRFYQAAKETLLPFLGPSVDGKVFTFPFGKRHKLLDLTAAGSFKLVPDYDRPGDS